MSTDFQNSLADRLSGKFATKSYLIIPSHFKYVAALPCEICSWLPPLCKQNLLLFIQTRWKLRTYFFNHHNVLF